MLQRFKGFVPHFITLLNLLSGCIAVYQVSMEAYDLAMFFVLLGVFFDFFDGLVARKLGVSSEVGVQLDSLADLVTSGVVPGFVMFKLIAGADMSHSIFTDINDLLPYLGFIITAGTAYRLAIFNVVGKGSVDFIGLAAPANAIMIVSWPLMVQHTEFSYWVVFFQEPLILIVLILLDVIILNANFKLFSFKLNDLSLRKNLFRYVLILSAIGFIVFVPYESASLIVLMYFILSHFHFKFVVTDQGVR